MRTLAALLLASIPCACQAFTGTGDLEVRDSASTSGAGAGGASATSAAGGKGGAGGAGGVGQGAGPTTSSTGSDAQQSSQAASSSTGMNCVNCGTAFETASGPSSVCSDTGKTAHAELIGCLCGKMGMPGVCYNMNTAACFTVCSANIPPDQQCLDCMMGNAACFVDYNECKADP